jgi:hypothetical protein
MGKTFLLVNSEEDPPVGVNLCSWVVVTNNKEFLHDPEVIASKTLTPQTGPLWTDDYSSIIPLLRK